MMAIELPRSSVQTRAISLSLSELVTQYLRGLEANSWDQLDRIIRRKLRDTLN